LMSDRTGELTSGGGVSFATQALQEAEVARAAAAERAAAGGEAVGGSLSPSLLLSAGGSAYSALAESRSNGSQAGFS
jgi:hypothetical protein